MSYVSVVTFARDGGVGEQHGPKLVEKVLVARGHGRCERVREGEGEGVDRRGVREGVL